MGQEGKKQTHVTMNLFGGKTSSADELYFQKEGAKLQSEDMIRMFNTLTERCFNDCIHDFSRRKLTRIESTCVDSCTDKYFAAIIRMQSIFTQQTVLDSQRAQKMYTGGAEDE